MNNKQLPKHGKNSNRNFFAFLALVLVIGAAGIAYVQHLDDANRQKLESKASSKKKSTSSSHQNLFVKKKSSSTSKIKSSSTTEKSVMRTPIDWQKSSETVDYPDLNKVENLWIEVRLSSNRTLLKDGDKMIYTMYSSGGKYHDVDGKQVSYTPTGTYYIENERGESFFNKNLNEGARYYISWLNHGEYLFHTVPTNAQGEYDVEECRKLGKQPASHGCIRLSVPDAIWLYNNLPVGTKVVINNK